MILLVFELNPAHLELKEDNLNWWRFGEGVMAAHKVRLGHGYDGSSHEAVHASIGTASISYGVVKVVPGWRMATEVRGGWISGWEASRSCVWSCTSRDSGVALRWFWARARWPESGLRRGPLADRSRDRKSVV